MRRLLFLALFVALVAGMGFSQVTWGGLFQYGVLSDGQMAPEQAAYLKLQFTDQLDQYNTIVMRYRLKDLNFVQGDSLSVKGGATSEFDRFYLSTDVTGALGVTGNVTMKLGFGFQDPNGGDLTGGISPFEVADLSGNDIGGSSQATIYPVVTINKMVNIGAIIAPGAFNKDATTQSGQGYEVFVNGGQGPVMAEVGYGNVYKGQVYPGFTWPAGVASADDPLVAGAQPALNFIWGAANYKGTQGDIAYAVALNGQYSLDGDSQGFLLRNHYAAMADDGSTVTYGYGVAGSVVYQGKYTVKAGLVGVEGAMLNRAELQGIMVLDPKLSVDAGAVFNLDSDYTSGSGAGTLNDFDIAANLMLGKGKFRLGWLFMDASAPYSVMKDDIGLIGDANGPTLPSMGVYLESSISF